MKKRGSKEKKKRPCGGERNHQSDEREQGVLDRRAGLKGREPAYKQGRVCLYRGRQRIGKIYPDQASAEGAYDQQRLHQCDGL